MKLGLTKERFTVDTQEELIELVEEGLKDPFSEGKKLEQVCLEVGLNDTINLLDERTIQLIELHDNYKYAPHLINYSIFMEANRILNQYEPRLI